MADDQAKKLLGNEWADSGDRTDPEDVNITRSVGWDVRYEQIGSGFEPEREVFNQLLRELSGWANDEIVNGVPPWDADVDYPKWAFVNTSSDMYIALVPTGPAAGNATDPLATGQTVWRSYS